jgi:hypothetical protein
MNGESLKRIGKRTFGMASRFFFYLINRLINFAKKIGIIFFLCIRIIANGGEKLILSL